MGLDGFFQVILCKKEGFEFGSFSVLGGVLMYVWMFV
jgi:hypothetical protein